MQRVKTRRRWRVQNDLENVIVPMMKEKFRKVKRQTGDKKKFKRKVNTI